EDPMRHGPQPGPAGLEPLGQPLGLVHRSRSAVGVRHDYDEPGAGHVTRSEDTQVEPILEAEGLVKRFGTVQALAGLDLVARRGDVTAVLGPNGAGKTTFVRAIATLVRPDAGTLRVAGIDAGRHPERVRRVIGLAGQFAAVEPTMTGRENVR